MSMRAYQLDDEAAVIAIANKAWAKIWTVRRAALGDEISDVLNPDGDAQAKGVSVARALHQKPEEFLVCERNGKIVGFIHYVIHGQLGEIEDNGADPDCGEKGIGQEMYQAVKDIFRANGVKVAYVMTGLDEAHAPARCAYQRAGFDHSLEHISYFMKI